MPVATSSEEFLDLFRKSKLVDEARIDAFVKALGDDVPQQPRALAEALARQGMLTPFQAGMLLHGKWRGFFLAGGKYKLLQLLGVGGMGKVYLCEHVRMKRLVALKVLPQDQTKDAGAVERFDREATAAAALNHPNIVRAHDIDRDGEVHFLVMEYVDGTPLHDVVKKHGPLDITRACHYISQAAHGLQHAHESGWVHRDIKPGNLLLDRGGNVRILDMGLARFLQDATGQTITERYDNKATLGTADYLAPEQAVNSHDVDIRADIYSFGASLYYLLTGRAPFEQGSIPEKLVAHQLKEPEPVSSLRPDVPKPLEAVLKKMMAKKTVHRYQTPLAVIEALQPWTQTRIDLPADEEMPRLCSALEGYLGAGMNGPISGIGHPASGRLVGPRSNAFSSARLPAAASMKWLRSLSGPKLYGLIASTLLVVLLTAFGLWKWATHGDAKAGGPGPVAQRPPDESNASRSADEKPKPKHTPIPIPPVADLPSTGTIVVSKTSGSANADESASTLTEAIAKAQPGRRIVVMDAAIEGALVLNDATRLAGVSIESGLGNGRRVTWAVAAGHAAGKPLVEVVGVPNLRIKGFQLSGRRIADAIVRLSGPCPGVTLDNVQVIDFATRGIEIVNLPAELERPVTLSRVRILPATEYAQVDRDHTRDVRESAIVVRSTTSPAGSGTALVIRNCRIEGMYKSAIVFGGPMHAEAVRNRFYTLKDDERPAPVQQCDAFAVGAEAMSGGTRLTLADNSVARYPNFVRFMASPSPGDPEAKVVVRNNVMVGGTSWALGDDSPAMKAVYAGSLGNVSRPQTCTRGLAIPRTTVNFPYLDVSLTDDTKFLRYTTDHILATAGIDGGPAGYPPD